MTPQEQQLLEDFLARVRNAGGLAKDPQADALIRERLAGQPDAAYLLVQRALLLEHALETAKAQIAQLQQAVAPPAPASFLGQDFNAPPPVPSAPAPQPAAPGWRERLFGGGAAAPQPAPVAAPAARAPSFLGAAATTAAGVAGGMFLFEGVESLLGGHHGGFLGGGAAQQPTVVENVTNNYYDDAPLQDADQDFADDPGADDDTWV